MTFFKQRDKNLYKRLYPHNIIKITMELRISPLTRIISLSGFLASGFLFVILSCALYHNYYPLFGTLIFLLAPIPNSLFGRKGYDTSDFMSDTTNNARDFGHFLTSMMVTSGIVLPFVFYHCQLIGSVSCIMSMVGGLIIYLSIIIFSWFFSTSWDSEDDNLFG